LSRHASFTLGDLKMKKLTALLSAVLLAMAGTAFAQKAETPKAAPAAPAAAPAAMVPTTKAEPAPAAKADAKKEPLDINSATKDELKALPGIGDAYADKIIKGRGKAGYSGKDDLLKKKILNEKTYDGVKEMIIAKQAKKDDKKK
jgi:competence protein ComEA